MSWTNECCTSNSFKVKNVEEVKQVIEQMGFAVYKNEDNSIQFYSTGEGTWFNDDTEVVLSIKPTSNNSNLIGLITDYIDSIDTESLEEGTYIVQPIVEYIQDQLEEGSACVITTAGYEERCSGSCDPFGDVLFITKNTYLSNSLYHWVRQMAETHKVEV